MRHTSSCSTSTARPPDEGGGTSPRGPAQDLFLGVAWKTQAKYLAQSFAIARKNPRIQMMIWFLVKDESRLAGWQSGFFTAAGKRKPAYFAFRAMKH